MKARIYVTLKNGVLDPQGKAVQGALNSMSFGEVNDVRVGKYMELTLKDDGRSKSEQETRVKQMCEKLLANTVVENYRVEIE